MLLAIRGDDLEVPAEEKQGREEALRRGPRHQIPAALRGIAGPAGPDQVVGAVRAAPDFRDEMVDGQILPRTTKRAGLGQRFLEPLIIEDRSHGHPAGNQSVVQPISDDLMDLRVLLGSVLQRIEKRRESLEREPFESSVHEIRENRLGGSKQLRGRRLREAPSGDDVRVGAREPCFCEQLVGIGQTEIREDMNVFS